jgi:hypothetical protein
MSTTTPADVYTCNTFPVADSLNVPFNNALHNEMQFLLKEIDKTAIADAVKAGAVVNPCTASCEWTTKIWNPLDAASTVSLTGGDLSACVTCMHKQSQLGNIAANAPPTTQRQARVWGCATCTELVAPLAYELELKRQAAAAPATVPTATSTYTTPTAVQLQTFVGAVEATTATTASTGTATASTATVSATTKTERDRILKQFKDLPTCIRAAVQQQVCHTSTTFSVLRDDDAVVSSGGSSGPNVGAIVGGVIGGLVGLILIGVVIWRRRANKGTPKAAAAETMTGVDIKGGATTEAVSKTAKTKPWWKIFGNK